MGQFPPLKQWTIKYLLMYSWLNYIPNLPLRPEIHFSLHPPSLLTMTEMNQDELIQELPSLRCELSWHFNIYGHLLLPKLLNMHCTSFSPQGRQIKWKSLTYLESTVYTFQMYLQTLACPHFWDLSKLTQFCIKYIYKITSFSLNLQTHIYFPNR